MDDAGCLGKQKQKQIVHNNNPCFSRKTKSFCQKTPSPAPETLSVATLIFYVLYYNESRL